MYTAMEKKEMIDFTLLVLFAVTSDADNNDGQVDRKAVYELCKESLTKLGVYTT